MGSNGRDTLNRPSGLGAALLSKSRLGILSLLYLYHDQRFYMRQIVRRVGLGVGAVQRELAALTRSGILLREKEGRQVFYRANRGCPIFQELRSIIVKTSGVAGVLREALDGIADRCEAAFVYGSLAQGTDDSESDVDIMVIGDVSFADVSRALTDVQTVLGREVNPTVYPPGEFRKKVGTPFLKSAIQKRKVFVIGDERVLAGLAR